MVTVTIDVSEAKEMFDQLCIDGRRRFDAITEWLRESGRRTIEALSLLKTRSARRSLTTGMVW